MTDSKTELLRKLLDERGVEYGTIDGNHLNTSWFAHGMTWWYDENTETGKTVFFTPKEYDLTPEQAVAATLGWIDEPDTIRNELADEGLIADALAPVCVDEKEWRAFLVGIRKLSQEIAGRFIGVIDGKEVEGYIDGVLQKQ